MSIKGDALKILAVLYNHKIKGIDEVRSDNSEIIKLGLSEIEFKNALEFLQGKKFVKIHSKLITRMLGPTDLFDLDRPKEKSKEELEEDAKYEYEEKIQHISILIKGVELMDSDKKFKSSFGDKFIKQTTSDKSILIIDNSTHISSPRLTNVKHEKTGDINYGNIIHNTVTQDNSKIYTVDKIDMSTHESHSIFIINKFGEKKPLIFGVVTFIAGIFTIITGLNSLMPDINIFSWVPLWLAVSPNFAPYSIAIGILLASLGGYLISLIQYKYDSQCPKCKKHYGMEEIGKPKVRETETKEGLRRTTTRAYKCKFCNYEKTKDYNDFIPNSELQD